MIHYTLNTGHSRYSPRSEVSDDVIELLRPLLEPGGHLLPGVLGPNYTLTVPISERGWIGTVSRLAVPLVTIGVAGSAADSEFLWPHLAELYWKLPTLPSDDGIAHKRPEPESTPWCAVVLIAPWTAEFKKAMDWLGDFERCLAWAWLERETQAQEGGR